MENINIEKGESVSFGFEINGIDIATLQDFSVYIGTHKFLKSDSSITQDVSNERLFYVRLASNVTSKLVGTQPISIALTTDLLGVHKTNKIATLTVNTTNEKTSINKTAEFIKATFVIDVNLDSVVTDPILISIYQVAGSGGGSTETASTIKTKYESNANTNAFTDILKTNLTTAYNWVFTNGANLLNHLTNTSNPHSVTKLQIGLSNVPNTDFTSAVNANTAKVSFDSTSSTRLANTSGTNTGDQDLSNLVTKVSGKSLIDDTEITRLASVTNQDLTGYATLSDLGTPVDTAFYEIAYSPTIIYAFDELNPNKVIRLTGNLSLTITDTVNKDSGMINLYFSGNQVATLNGLNTLVVTGAGEMIPVWFIHDTDGLRWSRDEVGVGSSEITVNNIAPIDGNITLPTTKFHKISFATGTMSNIGNACTAATYAIQSRNIGAKIVKANGQESFVVSVESNTDFTVSGFETNSIDTAYDLYNKAIEVLPSGGIKIYDANEGVERFNMSADGTVECNNFNMQRNGSAVKNGGQLEIYYADLRITNGSFYPSAPVYASDAAADVDSSLPSGKSYMVTGDRNLKVKP